MEPYLIEDIKTVTGETLYAHESAEDKPTAVRVLDERVAWLISDILSDDAARFISFGRNSLLNIG